jgi:hypothetical protein
MNDSDRTSLFDADLRAALEAETGAAERVARGALAAAPRRLRPSFAAAAVLATLAAGAWLALRPSPPSRSAAPATSAPRMVNFGAVVGVVDPAGRSSAAFRPQRAAEAPRQLIVVHGGES